MTDDRRKPIADELSKLVTNKRKSIEKDAQSKISTGRPSPLKLLNYNAPVGVCPKAELEDDCK